MDLIEDVDISCGGELMINSLKGIILSSYKVKRSLQLQLFSSTAVRVYVVEDR